MTTKNETGPRNPSRRRKWLFRCLAMIGSLLLVGFLETACWFLGLGDPGKRPEIDPGFDRANSLFVRDESGDRYVIRKSRLKFFVPESFPARKHQRAFRVFCLGGSTVQGRPYSRETAFSSWLELGLQAADQRREWEVINCGGVSYASYRLIAILRECLTYEPDVFIVCTGHNEFLEERTYGNLKRAPGFLVTTANAVMRLRISRVMEQGWLRVAGRSAGTTAASGPEFPSEVDAFLDYKNGLTAYHRDPEWHRRVIKEFDANLKEMINMARESGVPILLIRPPSNLRDCPPFKSEHRNGLSADELQRFTDLVTSARASYQTDLPGSIVRLRQAVVLDPQFAETHYALGKCYEALALPTPARQSFLDARELDVCPLRMLAPMERILSRVARETHTPLIDAHELLEHQSSWNILGSDWLVDHIHPTIQGHQLIAGAILAEMARQGWVKPEGDWQPARDRSYRDHFNSLDKLYFLHGQRRLRSLQAWTEGRADGPPIESRPPFQANPAASKQGP